MLENLVMDALQLTKTMQQHVQSKQWDSLQLVQAKRDSLLKDIFKDPTQIDDKLYEMLTQIQTIDQQMSQQVEAEKKETKTQLLQCKQGKKVKTAYEGSE